MPFYVTVVSADAASQRNAAVVAVRLLALVPQELHPRITTVGPDILLAVTAPARWGTDGVMAAVNRALRDPALSQWRVARCSEFPPPQWDGGDAE
jgi:hypothetical protein